MTRHVLALPPALLLSLVAGCSGGASGSSLADYTACLSAETAALTAAALSRDAPKGPFSAALLVSDPSRVESIVRDEVKASMRRSLESARASSIAFVRCEPLRPPPDRSYSETVSADSNTSEPGVGRGGGASEVSGTNNQVAGVDEADFIKNDDKYIYVVTGSTLRVIEAWPAETAHEIAKVPVPGTAKKLFVEGNRALVYSSTPRQVTNGGTNIGGSADVMYYPGVSGDCTYGYDGCVPAGDGSETEISIFDISDRTDPKLVRSIHSSSSLIAARRIGNAVHTVLGQPALTAPIGWEDQPRFSNTPSENEINEAYDVVIAKNLTKLDAVDLGTVLPTFTDSTGRSPDMALFQSSIPDGTALTSVLSIDLVSDPSLEVASVISRSGWVYASADALYMAVPHQQIAGWGWYDGRSESELSTIHKFSIGTAPSATAYVGTGVVKGRVLNQFAMDDKDGFLRVATTTGRSPNPDAHNTLSILEDRGGKLDVVGQIDQIAKSEDIRSVRFDGTRGYIVTFKNTDPLFVFDLTDPRAPRTMGELKIPGFSTYMHMLDETHLLTIGYDAADQDNFAFFTGVVLQIFDVSNPSDPKLTHKETIGTRGTSSEALTNHLAFNYFAPKNLLALPMTICEGGDGNGNYGSKMTFSGLMVYDTTVANGFSLRGRVSHPNASQPGPPRNTHGYYDVGCSSWWTNASSEVKRSIIMDDWIFSVSATRIKVNNLAALATDVKELSIQ